MLMFHWKQGIWPTEPTPSQGGISAFCDVTRGLLFIIFQKGITSMFLKESAEGWTSLVYLMFTNRLQTQFVSMKYVLRGSLKSFFFFFKSTRSDVKFPGRFFHLVNILNQELLHNYQQTLIFISAKKKKKIQ